MTVVAEKLPTEHTLLTVVDKVAARTAREARDAAAPVVARETPRKSGATAQALRPKATRTGTGHAVSIAVPRGRKHPRSSYGATINEVVRWVNRGTGELRVGPGRKRPIRGRRTGDRKSVV